MKILYFSWLRERIGLPSEELENRTGSVRDLIDQLRAREARYAMAFADLSAIRVAVDQQVTDLDASIEGATEVAFFPPMTGG